MNHIARLTSASILFGATLAVCAQQSLPPLRERGPPIETKQPSIVWRVDGESLPPNAIDKYNVALSPDAKTLAVVREPNVVSLLSAESGARLAEYAGRPLAEESAYSVAYSSAGRLAIGRLGLAQVYAGKPEPASLVTGFATTDRAITDSVAFSPDGKWLAMQQSTTYEQRVQGIGSVDVIDSQTGKRVVELRSSAAIPRVSFSVDGRWLVAIYRPATEMEGVRVWRTSDWTLARERLAECCTTFATGSARGDRQVIVYWKGDNLEMHDLADDRLIWSAPLIPPQFAPSTSTVVGVKLDHAEISADGKVIVSYEAPQALDFVGNVAGGLVIRSARDGSVLAVYDVPGVWDIAIARDGKSFVYAATGGHSHVARVRLPE